MYSSQNGQIVYICSDKYKGRVTDNMIYQRLRTDEEKKAIAEKTANKWKKNNFHYSKSQRFCGINLAAL